MRLIGNNPFDLIGQKGESIAVEIHSGGTAFLVHYSLNGQHGTLYQGQPLIFTLTAHDTLLHLSFDFTSLYGGAYRIRVGGSAGGDVSDYILSQSPTAALTYRFQLARDERRGKPRFSGGSDLGGDETKDDY